MMDFIFGILGLIVLVGIFWLTARFLRDRQNSEDRRYGSNDSGSGYMGDSGPV